MQIVVVRNLMIEDVGIYFWQCTVRGAHKMMTKQYSSYFSGQGDAHKLTCMLIACLFVFLQLTDAAVAEERFTSNEVPLLPQYCRDAQSFADKYGSRAGYEARMNQLGPTFHHIHHYCWALVAIQRSGRSNVNRQHKEAYLRSALQDINYVLERATPNFVLLPEILTRKGEVLYQLKDFPPAEQSLRKAIETKPDYWPAYRELATLYRDTGKRDAARTVLERGLTVVSEKRVLQRMLDELNQSTDGGGGKSTPH